MKGVWAPKIGFTVGFITFPNMKETRGIFTPKIAFHPLGDFHVFSDRRLCLEGDEKCRVTGAAIWSQPCFRTETWKKPPYNKGPP